MAGNETTYSRPPSITYGGRTQAEEDQRQDRPSGRTTWFSDRGRPLPPKCLHTLKKLSRD